MSITNCYLIVCATDNRVIEVIPDWQRPDVLPWTLTDAYDAAVYAVRAMDINDVLSAPGWTVSDRGSDGTFVQPMTCLHLYGEQS